MYTTSMCLFLKLKLYFVEMEDLVSLTCFATDHVICESYATTYADQ